MSDNYTPGPVRGVKTTNSAAPTADNIGALVALANASAPSYTEGNEVLLSTDLAGNLRTTFGGTVSENLAQVNGVTVLTGAGATGTGSQRITVAQDTTTIAGSAPGTAGTPSANVVTVQGVTGGTVIPVSQATAANLNATVVQGSPGTAANGWFAKVTDGTNTAAVKAASTAAVATDPAIVVAISPNNTIPVNNTQIDGVALLTGNGVTGTGSQRVTIASDNTAFAVKVTANGTTNALSAPIFTQLSDGTNAVGTPTNPLVVDNVGVVGTSKFKALTSASLAAAGSVTLAGTAITTSKTGYLQQVTVGASIMQKVTVQTFDGTTATTLAVFFVPAEETFVWRASTNLMFPFAGGAAEVFQVTIKNMDTAAADVYATLEWTEQ